MDLHPHKHILSRLSEDFSTNPSFGMAEKPGEGDSQVVASHTKKEVEEFHSTGEEKREVRLADRILKAANLLPKDPNAEEIIRAAEELKRMHGVTESK